MSSNDVVQCHLTGADCAAWAHSAYACTALEQLSGSCEHEHLKISCQHDASSSKHHKCIVKTATADRSSALHLTGLQTADIVRHGACMCETCRSMHQVQRISADADLWVGLVALQT